MAYLGGVLDDRRQGGARPSQARVTAAGESFRQIETSVLTAAGRRFLADERPLVGGLLPPAPGEVRRVRRLGRSLGLRRSRDGCLWHGGAQGAGRAVLLRDLLVGHGSTSCALVR